MGRTPSHNIPRLVTRAALTMLSGVFGLMCVATEAATAQTAPRRLTPADMFAIEEVGPTAWSPDGREVAVQFLRSDRRLDWNVPESDLRVLDVATGRWQTIAARGGRYLG